MTLSRPLRLLIYAILGLVLLLVLLAGIVYAASEGRMRSTYEIEYPAIPIVTDSASVERGRHLAVTRGCTECHGEDLGGQVFLDEPAIGFVYARNITPAPGSRVASYTDTDWIRAIRHGVGPDQRPLLIMPSEEYQHLSPEDLGALIAYLETVPPVERPNQPSRVGPMGRILFVLGKLKLLPAEYVAHDAPPPSAPPIGATVEYGEYLSSMCVGCHREDLSGGTIPGMPPDFPPARNLTPHQDGLAGWTREDWYRALREGRRPDGTELQPEYMPWTMTARMTDEELDALWMYVRALPPRPTGR